MKTNSRITLVVATSLTAFPLGQSPWQPPASADCDLIDYADLGDHERDPFVMQIQAAEGGGHVHGQAR